MFRKQFGHSDDVYTGSAFYPREVYEILDQMRKDFKRADELMKEYYKNA